MSARPRIAITLSRRSAWRIFPLFALSVLAAGGVPRLWLGADDVDLDAVDGVVIGGGDDISPALYGGELVAEARFDDARDDMEKTIVAQAVARDLPVLGVCRGAQMINVALGGTLHADAYGVFSSRRFKTILPRKRVSVAEDSRLARLCGTRPMQVNALHTQSVNSPGDAIRVVAQDEGGMPQAVERDADPFVLGVQWHPEHLFFARRQRRLFRGLVAAARARRQAAAQLARVDALPPEDA